MKESTREADVEAAPPRGGVGYVHLGRRGRHGHYPPVSSIPRATAARLARATPAEDRCPDAPVPSASAAGRALMASLDVGSTSLSPSSPPSTSRSSATAFTLTATASAVPSTVPSTVLYLAYGSNMAAETFLGQRGIRPLSQVNVLAPTLRLTFDLPGMPYREPCFANTAIRKIPDGKPPFPLPEPPRLPPRLAPPPSPSSSLSDSSSSSPYAHKHAHALDVDVERGPAQPPPPRAASHGDPVWDKGLIGVVYEVTPEDYAHILATEGANGGPYIDILVPCFEIPPPRIGVPEGPGPVPVPPPPPVPKRPFLAHTLYSPRPPPPGDGEDDDEAAVSSTAGDGGASAPSWKLPSWARRLLLPTHRPDPEYAQPSARYLQLLRDGAEEHGLPEDYRAWLDALVPYSITTRRQKLGQLILNLVWVPFFLILLGLRFLLKNDLGHPPPWLTLAMSGAFNLVWMSYDTVWKPVFGDGERTEETGDDTRTAKEAASSSQEEGSPSEKTSLLAAA